MNNPLLTTVIVWHTRNAKRSKLVADRCQDYGLCQVMKNLWLGKMKRRERLELLAILRQTFIGKAESFYLLPLCKSCFDEASFDKIIKTSTACPASFEVIN